MWFKFPEGVTEVSIQQQNFKAEVRDAEGRSYFRVPNHFANTLLMLNGFVIAEPPEGAPADLPQPDTLRDGAIADLSHKVESLQREITGLRSDIVATNAARQALMSERDKLKSDLEEAQEKIADLENKLNEDGD